MTAISPASPRSRATSPSASGAEEELEEARAALFQSQKLQALGELTGGIAHDFNNLLTVIRGSAELLQRPGAQRGEARAAISTSIIETADRATTLTNHLLAFGRRQALKPEVLDLNLRLDAFAEMVGRTFGSLYRGGARSRLGPVAGRGRRRPARDRLAQRRDQRARRDAGGRPADPHDPQPAATATRSASSSPTPARACRRRCSDAGLRAVLHHQAGRQGHRPRPVPDPRLRRPDRRTRGDRLDARARARGCASSCRAPTKPRRAKDEAESLRTVATPGSACCWSRTMTRSAPSPSSLLAELRCEVIGADSGEEALELLGREQVDLVFTDVVMPGMSGIELASRVRERLPGPAGAARQRL